jgi:hypothetical protein
MTRKKPEPGAASRAAKKAWRSMDRQYGIGAVDALVNACYYLATVRPERNKAAADELYRLYALILLGRPPEPLPGVLENGVVLRELADAIYKEQGLEPLTDLELAGYHVEG